MERTLPILDRDMIRTLEAYIEDVIAGKISSTAEYYTVPVQYPDGKFYASTLEIAPVNELLRKLKLIK